MSETAQPSELDEFDAAAVRRILGDLTPEHLNELGFVRQELSDVEHVGDIRGGRILLVAAAERMEIAFYKDRAGNVLLGSINENMHRHDRWLFLRVAGREDWHHADVHHPGNEPVPDAGQRIVWAWENMRNRMITSEALSQDPAAYWIKYRLPSHLVEPLTPLMTSRNLSKNDLHDLIFHYPAWLARNTEYASLPRDIVLRMQGFGPFLDSLTEHDQHLPVY